jgi:hypothetical protein
VWNGFKFKFSGKWCRDYRQMRPEASEYLQGGGKSFVFSIIYDSENLLKHLCNKIFVDQLDKH